MIRYCLTIFLSAFLLFQVQPLIAKFILPWFGGGPAVWTTCMLFFQSLLLLGYAYAHAITRWCSPRVQCVSHSAALAATLIVLPITPQTGWKPTSLADPTWHILFLLLLCIGAPYLFLSATTPLIQSWFSKTHPNSTPYRLFALSNFGSLLGLLTYPLIVERLMSLETQTTLWSAAYVAFALLCGASAVQILRSSTIERNLNANPDTELSTVAAASECEQRPRVAMGLLWLSLSCCGSVMLLATTNVICRDVASVPFLWVLPLALYLLSFIVCFDREHWYLRDLFGVALVASICVHFLILFYLLDAPLWLQITHFSVLLTLCCFVCHGELVRLKPSPRHLTGFYLIVAAGGALGGVLVTLVAPAVFPDYYEHNAAVIGTVILLLLMYRLDRWRQMDRASRMADLRKTAIRGTILATAFSLTLWAYIAKNSSGEKGVVVANKRNFYGALMVYHRYSDNPEAHQLLMAHGNTAHGFQFLDESKRQVPTSYYARPSGIGLAITRHPQYPAAQRPIRLGVIGLGTGTLACYARTGDYLRFYEIDPLVVEFSEKHFTYQKDARARGADVDVYLGDARMVMERQIALDVAEQFDVLAVDAFSSDSIPVHLLTWECFETYRKHLQADGIIAFHVSNRHLELASVVRKLAERGGMQSLLMRFRPAEGEASSPASPLVPSDWVLVSGNEQFLLDERVQADHSPWAMDARPPVLWTDDFSNLFDVIRW